MSGAEDTEGQERWVNAVIQMQVPLDIGVDVSGWDKQEAVGDLMEKLIEVLPDEFAEHVGTGRWEDVDEGEPIRPESDPTQLVAALERIAWFPCDNNDTGDLPLCSELETALCPSCEARTALTRYRGRGG